MGFWSELTVENRYLEVAYGKINPQVICPQCQTWGKVRAKEVTKKMGVSGMKATARPS